MTQPAPAPCSSDLARQMRRSALVASLLLGAANLTPLAFAAAGASGPKGAETSAFLQTGILGLALAVAGLAVMAPLARRILAATRCLEAAQAELVHNALHDHLTGLPNRRYIEDHLALVLAGAKRNGQMTAVLHIDLDGFKAINDRHGHGVGDRMLVALSEVMKMTIRRSDFLGRMGGDEFVVIVSDLRNPRGLEILADRLIERIGGPVQVGEKRFGISASVGIALSPPIAADGPSILAEADVALYEAKEQGRAGYRFHRESQLWLDSHHSSAPLALVEETATI